MKNLALISLFAFSQISLAFAAPGSVDAPAVAATLKPLLADAIEVDANGDLVMDSAGNGYDDKGVWLEDCRKVALRQALLDITSKNEVFAGFSRKYSHKLSQVEESLGGTDFKRAFVAARVHSGGQTVERTFQYLLYDPSTGHCDIKKKEGMREGVTKRRDLELWVESLINKGQFSIHPYSEACYGKDCGDAKSYAAAHVGKLIEWDCEQASLNKAIELSNKYFVAKYGSNPIMVIDYRRSLMNIDGQYSEMKGMKGNWVITMTDRTGKQAVSTSVGFDLVEKAESAGQPGACAGTYDNEVTVVK